MLHVTNESLEKYQKFFANYLKKTTRITGGFVINTVFVEFDCLSF